MVREGLVIHTGDCIEVMAGMEADSMDAVVTDPPYGLEFMGKEWDRFEVSRANRGTQTNRKRPAGETGTSQKFQLPAPAFDLSARGRHAFQAWCEAWGREALRVTKPGGYLLAFGGTRTHHRLVCGLEDAGWIIRDELDWIYASGFPKGKANLKPAHEPIVLARKPGPLRPLAIDECRIPGAVPEYQGLRCGHPRQNRRQNSDGTVMCGACLGAITEDERRGAKLDFQDRRTHSGELSTAGRWPSNVLLSDPEVFDTANPDVVGSGAVASSGLMVAGQQRVASQGGGGYRGDFPDEAVDHDTYGDSGGYSRFFIVPKADRADREPVLRGQLERVDAGAYEGNADVGGNRKIGARPDLPVSQRENAHPTVKPTDLMRHLVRLVTPIGGTVLDCFLGSGSTAIAAEMEGFAWIGIEKEPEYVAIAEARLNGVQRGLGLDLTAKIDSAAIRPGVYDSVKTMACEPCGQEKE